MMHGDAVIISFKKSSNSGSEFQLWMKWNQFFYYRSLVNNPFGPVFWQPSVVSTWETLTGRKRRNLKVWHLFIIPVICIQVASGASSVLFVCPEQYILPMSDGLTLWLSIFSPLLGESTVLKLSERSCQTSAGAFLQVVLLVDPSLSWDHSHCIPVNGLGKYSIASYHQSSSVGKIIVASFLDQWLKRHTSQDSISI